MNQIDLMRWEQKLLIRYLEIGRMRTELSNVKDILKPSEFEARQSDIDDLLKKLQEEYATFLHAVDEFEAAQSTQMTAAPPPPVPKAPPTASDDTGGWLLLGLGTTIAVVISLVWKTMFGQNDRSNRK